MNQKMNLREAQELAKKIEKQGGYQTYLTGYVSSKIIGVRVVDHVTGYTMHIDSPEEWAERERLSRLYSKVY